MSLMLSLLSTEYTIYLKELNLILQPKSLVLLPLCIVIFSPWSIPRHLHVEDLPSKIQQDPQMPAWKNHFHHIPRPPRHPILARKPNQKKQEDIDKPNYGSAKTLNPPYSPFFEYTKSK